MQPTSHKTPNRDAAVCDAIAALSDPRDLDRVLAAIVGPSPKGGFLQPWRAVLTTPVERQNAYVDLCKQLGPRYAECSFRNYHVTHDAQRIAFERLLEWTENMPERLQDGGDVTLFGAPGVGKDHLLAAMMFYAVLAHGYTVDWVNGLDLYQEIRKRIRDDAGEQDLVRRYQKPLILVVSDPLPPKGEISRYNADVLYRIIDRRYRDRKSTWATMNVDGGDEADSRLAANLVDRLKHNSLTIHCDWPSFRTPLGPPPQTGDR